MGIRYAVLALLLVCLPRGGVLAQGDVRGSVSTDVRAAVRSGQGARVVVALEEPAVLKSGEEVDPDAMRRAVGRVQSDVLSAVSGGGFETTLRYEAVPALVGRVTSTAALEQLAGHPRVRRIDRDAGAGGAGASVEIVRADEWHGDGVTGEGVRVAVLDSGIDTDHDDLSGDLVHEACFLNIDGRGQCPNGSDRQTGPGAAEDDNGHGTSVSGIITSDAAGPRRGVAPAAEIVAVKVLNANARYSFYSELVAALDYLINRPELGVQAVNMSLGTDAQFGQECDETTSWNMSGASAVEALRSQGVLVVASSMNTGSPSLMASPACLRQVVSVGATDAEDRVTDFTNSNRFLDVVAPGVRVQTTGLSNSSTTFSGTSAAAPHVTGCAALLADAGTDTTPDEVEESLKTSPTQAGDPKNGLTFPRLDCYSAKQLLSLEGPAISVSSGHSPEDPTIPFALEWQTTLERTSLGFVVERRVGTGSGDREGARWRRVGFVDTKAAAGVSTDTLSYRYEGMLPTAGQYTFRLRHATTARPEGGRSAGTTASVDVPLGGAFSLGGPQPNPSRGAAAIELVVEETQEVRLAIYDVLGRPVRVLYDNHLSARTPLLLRTSERGLAAGTYFVRATGRTFAETRKMVVVR